MFPLAAVGALATTSYLGILYSAGVEAPQKPPAQDRINTHVDRDIQLPLFTKHVDDTEGLARALVSKGLS